MEMWDLAAADERVRFSPYCWRIHFALAHKGLAATTHAWRFTEKDAIGFSGQGFVPVLKDDGRVVADSWAIADYLDATYPQRPLMAGPQARALTNFMRQWVQITLTPIIMRGIMPELFAAVAEKDRAYFRESREQRFGRRLEDVAAPLDAVRADLKTALHPLRLALGAEPFVSGAEPAFADYVVMGAFMWVRCISRHELLEEGDAVFLWRERMLDLYDGLGRRAPRAHR